jgi:hypothetical protein
MSTNDDPGASGIEHRFHDLSADVREERLIRYVVHHVKGGRHVNDILNDPYVVAHFDETARDRVLENPEVIESIEQQIRRQFADYGGSVPGQEADSESGGGDQDSGEA